MNKSFLFWVQSPQKPAKRKETRGSQGVQRDNHVIKSMAIKKLGKDSRLGGMENGTKEGSNTSIKEDRAQTGSQTCNGEQANASPRCLSTTNRSPAARKKPGSTQNSPRFRSFLEEGELNWYKPKGTRGPALPTVLEEEKAGVSIPRGKR